MNGRPMQAFRTHSRGSGGYLTFDLNGCEVGIVNVKASATAPRLSYRRFFHNTYGQLENSAYIAGARFFVQRLRCRVFSCMASVGQTRLKSWTSKSGIYKKIGNGHSTGDFYGDGNGQIWSIVSKIQPLDLHICKCLVCTDQSVDHLPPLAALSVLHGNPSGTLVLLLRHGVRVCLLRLHGQKKATTICSI
ncbi:hypothetical protein EGR_09105 [Echinococcus granulosus]|uniref:Uncharacterized protein n=1 Tax=Echinococcus granulosus TaxID=6210 RepID=W6U4I0_ECHGR|nr:hypothetical protein EGR_09105 [Echinococcus granulosus]EUB56025.1 hypothetical protein EGR_09105 [Echinococcus granulosus]